MSNLSYKQKCEVISALREYKDILNCVLSRYVYGMCNNSIKTLEYNIKEIENAHNEFEDQIKVIETNEPF